MKRLILTLLLIPMWAGAATYYVDCNSDGDAGSGLTTASNVAWKTIAKVNASSFNPGDNIYFKRGEAWREMLIPPSSGSSELPITFGAYGTGNAPIISGSVIPSAGQWADVGGNLWIIGGVTTAINRVRFDGTVGTNVNPPAGANQWTYDADEDILGVYSAGNPATTYTNPGVEVFYLSPVVYVNNVGYITITDLTVQDDNSWAGIIISGTSNHVTVKNCTVRDCMGSGIQLNETTGGNNLFEDNTVHENYGQGIHFYKSSSTAGNEDIARGNTISANGMDGILLYANRTIIEHNIVAGNGTRTDQGVSGIRCYDDPDGGGSHGDYNIIRYNSVSNQTGLFTDGHGILLDHYCDNNQIYYNISHGNGGVGIGVYKSLSASVYNNVAYGNGQVVGGALVPTEFGIIDDELDRTINVTLKNNIGFATVSGQYAIMSTGTVENNEGISLTNNEWYRSSGPWYNVAATPGATLATWNAFSFVGSDLNSDPLFIDAAGGDFRLRSGSPCINAGTDVGLTSDYEGYPVPSGALPDIGAYEFGRPSLARGGISGGVSQ